MNTKWVITLPEIRLRANHGIHDFEKENGNDFIVSLKVYPDLDNSIADNLDSTIDYEHLYRIVTEEMQITSDLLEEVVRRIAQRIMVEHPTCRSIEVRLSKLNPETMPGTSSAEVTISMSR